MTQSVVDMQQKSSEEPNDSDNLIIKSISLLTRLFLDAQRDGKRIYFAKMPQFDHL